MTALADAYRDSVPIVAVTGQVPRALIGTDAFQEVDIVTMARPVIKQAVQVTDAARVPEAVHEAFAVAHAGRPGPVLIDVPKDVQQAPLRVAPGAGPKTRAPAPEPPEQAVADALCLLSAAERPVLYVGGVLRSPAGSDALRALAERCDIPVTATLMGLGLLPSTHPLWLGMLGMHAAPFTNLALHRPRQLLTSGGLGTMGFGLPAAIGAALATGQRTVCVTGDGSLMLSWWWRRAGARHACVVPELGTGGWDPHAGGGTRGDAIR